MAALARDHIAVCRGECRKGHQRHFQRASRTSDFPPLNLALLGSELILICVNKMTRLAF